MSARHDLHGSYLPAGNVDVARACASVGSDVPAPATWDIPMFLTGFHKTGRPRRLQDSS
ncbi:MAG: hypothetical protein R3A49_00670 [Acidimicrobiia bacterium]